MKKKPRKQSTEKAVEKGTGSLDRTIKKTRPSARATGKGRKKTAIKHPPKTADSVQKKKPSRSKQIQLNIQARRATVRKYILEGKNCTAISRILKMNRRTIEGDIKLLRDDVMGFVESNEEFLTNMLTHHSEITIELNNILKNECVVVKGGEEQPSAFLKVECIKAMTSENKETASLLFKLGKIKEAPKKVEGDLRIGWQEYTADDKEDKKKKS